MSSRSITTQGNPLLFSLMALLLALILAFSIMLQGKLAIFGLVGVLFFICFFTYPVYGLYATTVLLLLSGSTGVIGFVGQEEAMAVTLSKICGTAALGAWMLNVLIRKIRLTLGGPTLLLVLFCAWALMCTIISAERAQVWPEWIRLFTLLGYFLLAVNTLNTPRNLHHFIVLLVMCGFVMSAVAVAQYVFPRFYVGGEAAWATLGAVDGAYIDQESLQGEAAIRVSGRAGHSNWLAMIILLLIPLNFYWYSVTKKNLVKVLIVITFVLEVIALILTYTRTGLMIGTVLGALLFMKQFYRLTPLRISLGFLALVMLWLALPAAYKERVLNPRQYTRSISVMSRLDMQTAAMRYSLENPVFGLGPGGFGIEYIRENTETARTMRYMVDRMGWQPVFVGAHNMYLQLASDMGFVGLSIFIAFYIVLMRHLYRLEEQYIKSGDTQGAAMAGALFISLLAFLLCAVFLHALQQKIWWMVTAVTAALVIYQCQFKKPTEPNITTDSKSDEPQQ